MRFVVLALCATLILVAKSTVAYERTSAYEQLKIFEWTVFVSPSLKSRPGLKNTMLRNLTAQLSTIRSSIRPQAMRHIIKSRIWLEVSAPGEDARHVVGQYFSSRTRLRELGMNPDKYEDIQLNALFAKDVTNGTVVFHELAHVYHFGRIRGSNRIQRLWESAWLTNPKARDKCRNLGKPYAFRNPGEFFATYSQAYLGRTCSFPYDRATIQRIDPKMLAFLQKTWGAPSQSN